MTRDKVSVVLPVHYVNRKWLKRAIESVLEQDYKNTELIVVNDMATESIDDLIRFYNIEKYIKNYSRMKLAYSFNRGFEAADGEYFSWVAGDDFMLPGMISRLVSEIKKNPEAGIVSGRTLVIDDNDNIIEKPAPGLSVAERHGLKFENNLVDKRYVYFSTISSCWLLKKIVWETVRGFDENLYGEEDYDFWIRAARSFKIYRATLEVPPLYAYRVHSQSISSTVPYCYSRARIKILKREQVFFPNDKVIKLAIKHFQKRQLIEWKKRQIDWRLARLKNRLSLLLNNKR